MLREAELSVAELSESGRRSPERRRTFAVNCGTCGISVSAPTPYWKRSLLALLLLATLVVLDLSIPRLIQRLIDRGIQGHDRELVIHTTLLMLAVSAVSIVVAVGNNNLSVFVGERVSRDLRAALFRKIQTFSYGNLDRQKTGQLMVRLTSDTGAVQR